MAENAAHQLSPELRTSSYFHREVDADDLGQLLSLFASVYPESTWAGLRHLRALWRWRYEDVPDGARSEVSIHRATRRLVAHVGGLRFRTQVFGEPRTSVQALDTMVSPQHCFRASGASVLADLIHEWWEACVIAPGSTFAWGIPSSRSHCLRRRAAGFELVERRGLLTRTVDLDWARDQQRGCMVRAGVARAGGIPADLDRLWERCREEHAISLVRDRDYFAWRYARRPGREYRVLSCRDGSTGVLRGCAVVTVCTSAPSTLALVDWLVPLSDGEVVAALFSGVMTEASRRGARTLSAWFPRAHAWARCFRAWGFQEEPTRIPVLLRSIGSDFDLQTFREGYYGTLGDSDWA